MSSWQSGCEANKKPGPHLLVGASRPGTQSPLSSVGSHPQELIAEDRLVASPEKAMLA